MRSWKRPPTPTRSCLKRAVTPPVCWRTRAAYRDQVIAEAQGQADRFNSIYEEYVQAPDVTRERMYLETMEPCWAGPI
jgi:hypothetical protein